MTVHTLCMNNHECRIQMCFSVLIQAKYSISESFLVVIDHLLSALDQRLDAYQMVSSRFGFLGRLSTIPSNELSRHAMALVDAYPDDLDNSLADELSQFVFFANVFMEDDFDEISTELFLYRLIHQRRVIDIFPNVEIALRIYLTLMVSNCTGERSFSKLKLVENRLRTTMTQDRLVNLTVMSMESDILRETDFGSIVNEFAIRKSRKIPV